MTSELPLAEGRHNHPPICCCLSDATTRTDTPCPACPEHSELAQGVECPQCHQAAGRPHTDYCPLAIREDVFGQTSQPATRTSQPHTEARCGFRSLDNTDLICTYPPHRVDKPHSWQDGGDPRGWRNAIDPNKDR
jgi:hypothetical protein